MATPRASVPRGTRVRGASGAGAGSGSRRGRAPAGAPDGPGLPAEPIADPTAPRAVIDYALQRRAALLSLFQGGALDSDHLEADPYLLRAARFHGEPAQRRCPVCRRQDLDLVTYVFGDELGHASGSARATADLPTLARTHGELRVYVVEVCRGCSWNHLCVSYVVGDGVPRRPSPRPRDLLD